MVVIEQRRDPRAVERILRSLPEWFGIDDAIVEYVESAGRLDSFLAVRDDQIIGVALVKQHFPASVELTLLAVQAGEHRGGIGAALVAAVADHARTIGARLLEVHTVGPSFDNEPYTRTRAFYERVGFLPVHEFDGIDGWDGPTLVLVMPL